MDYNFAEQTLGLIQLILVLSIMGLALYRSAITKDKRWFLILYLLPVFNLPIIFEPLIGPLIGPFTIVFILSVNLIYLFRFSKKRLTKAEIKSWIQKLRKR